MYHAIRSCLEAPKLKFRLGVGPRGLGDLVVGRFRVYDVVLWILDFEAGVLRFGV